MDRLPALGLDPSTDIDYTTQDVARAVQSWPPPFFSVMLSIHGAFNIVLRAFNAMLNDEYQPSEIYGARLHEYMQNVSFHGFGAHLSGVICANRANWVIRANRKFE